MRVFVQEKACAYARGGDHDYLLKDSHITAIRLSLAKLLCQKQDQWIQRLKSK